MPISTPRSTWERITRSKATLDAINGVIGAGGLAGSSVRSFATGDSGWGFFQGGLSVLAFGLGVMRARFTYRDEQDGSSTHELQGCLHALETILLGADLAPERRAAAGLRLTIHAPDRKGSLVQVMPYVGDQRTPNSSGRKMPENMGVVGQAYQRAKLHGAGMEIHSDYRTSDDYDAFIAQMVRDYAFTTEAAKKLSAATKSWLAVPLTSGQDVDGVLYCDSKRADFFTDARKEDILHATAGIAYFVGLRYD